MNLKVKNIDISPELIKATAIQYGALVKVVYNWVDNNLPEYKKYEEAPIVMASIAFLCGNLPDGSQEVEYNSIANMVMELFMQRQIVLDEDKFICEEWDESVPVFDRDLGDLGLFTVMTAIGFHKDFDAIEVSEHLYPFRQLVLDYAKIGFDQEDEDAISCYEQVAAFFMTNKNNDLLFKAICGIIGE